MLDLRLESLPTPWADSGFPLLVPLPFIARMRRADPHDPLLRQVLPLSEELLDAPGYSEDPLAEDSVRIAPGLLQKYPGRALLIASPACAVHCRYCFRRHYPYLEAGSRVDAWAGALRRIEQDASISEVILSGGDPLMLSDRRLETLLEAITAIPHVELLRIHTRLPVVLPSRVTAALCAAIERSLPATVVLHSNHAAEIDDTVVAAVARLRASGATLLNQSVLLRGVNDDASTLTGLSRRLGQTGVLPYYLHLPDRVAGTAHFAVERARGMAIIQTLHDTLPGYLVPRFVEEVPGDSGKRVIR